MKTYLKLVRCLVLCLLLEHHDKLPVVDVLVCLGTAVHSPEVNLGSNQALKFTFWGRGRGKSRLIKFIKSKPNRAPSLLYLYSTFISSSSACG